jgi:hypothetical protein
MAAIYETPAETGTVLPAETGTEPLMRKPHVAQNRSTQMKALAAALLVAFVSTQPLVAGAVAVVPAPQKVAVAELQRDVYSASYPVWCGAAQQAASAMRFKPTADSEALRGVMVANITGCATTAHAYQHPGLWGKALFSAAAAALLAARSEPPHRALQDATHAQSWAALVANFTFESRPNGQPSGDDPLRYRTDAGRIESDAEALIAALRAGGAAVPQPPDDLPNQIPVPSYASNPQSPSIRP